MPFKKRLDRLLNLLNDPDLELTLMEKITHAWCWGRCEYWYRKRLKAYERFHKNAKKFDDLAKVYRLRKGMKDL